MRIQLCDIVIFKGFWKFALISVGYNPACYPWVLFGVSYGYDPHSHILKKKKTFYLFGKMDVQ